MRLAQRWGCAGMSEGIMRRFSGRQTKARRIHREFVLNPVERKRRRNWNIKPEIDDQLSPQMPTA